MRIALVARGGFDRSGREHVIPALLSLMERLGRRHDVHVFVLRYHDEPCTYSLLGATIHDLGGGTSRGPGWLALGGRLRDAMRAVGSFDVLHGYMAGHSGALAALTGRLFHIPVVVTLDGGELVALPEIGYGLQLTWRGRLMVAAALRLATRVTACSESVARAARARGIAVDGIPLGVDTSVFTPAAIFPGPPWRLLHVASLNGVKDQALLLRALRRVVQCLPTVRLDVVGADTLGGAVQRQCGELGLEGHVTFHGFRPSENVRDFCQRSHLFVQSSRHEAAGVAVLEAAACGVPTVGTAVGYVADGAPERALAVPVGDAEALAEGIVTVLSDGPRRERMGRAARVWAEANDANVTAARFEALYAQVVGVR